MVYLRALLGVLAFCLLAWLMSDNKKKIPWRVIAGGIFLQLFLAWFILKTDTGAYSIQAAVDFVVKLIDLNKDGTSLVFGNLATSGSDGVMGFALGFAVRGLTIIIFLSALMAILYYIGIMQCLVWVLARIMAVTMGVSGAEALCMATNIFMGQTEAPLTIRPYLPRMTRSELNSVMTGGFATMAAGMIAVYIGILGHNAFYGKHILAAEVMSAPAAFVICKLIRPETETPETSRHMPFKIERKEHNILEAAATGTRDGLHLWLNVIAMLISFAALLALANWMMGSCHDGLLSVSLSLHDSKSFFHLPGLANFLDWFIGSKATVWSLQSLAGSILSPVAWLIGIDNWHDCKLAGSVMGTKIASNEFFGYLQLSSLIPPDPPVAASLPVALPPADLLLPRSAILCVYSICDFANFVSIGIQIGGMTPLAENRKADFAKLAFRAMLGGCLASYMTAAIAGMFV